MISAHASGLSTMTEAVKYHQWIYDVVRPYIGKRVLEVGGGLGTFSDLLQDRERLVIVDNDPVCIRHLADRFCPAANVRVLEADILDDIHLETLISERPDSAICINVLEHIWDDRKAVQHIYDVLQPGGYFVLLVPAHPVLYGIIDQNLGHIRRYTKKHAAKRVADAGFSVVRAQYFNSVGVAGWYMISRMRRQETHQTEQVRFYDQYVVPVVSRVERVVSPPFGQSVVVIGRK
jgi:SAM-dependent methyltransferase